MHAFHTLINAINFDNIVLSLLIKMYINKYIFFRCNGHFFFFHFLPLCADMSLKLCDVRFCLPDFLLLLLFAPVV